VDDSDLGILLRAMADVIPKSAKIGNVTDFFDDLGGHSLIAAQLVSKLRKESPEGSVLKSIGLEAIYQHRTAETIVASFGGSSGSEKCPQSIAAMGDHGEVSKRKYILCGIAQVPALFFFFLVEAISILVPYLVFFFALREFGLAYAILITYSVFVGILLAGRP